MVRLPSSPCRKGLSWYSQFVGGRRDGVLGARQRGQAEVEERLVFTLKQLHGQTIFTCIEDIQTCYGPPFHNKLKP
jgi:hypothetical protein